MARQPAYGPAKNTFSQDLPRPVPRSGGAVRAWIWALAACAALAAIAFWVTRQPEETRQLREKAAEEVNQVLRETPLAGLGNILRETPPLPPLHGENSRSLPGTLYGSSVRGGIGQPAQGSTEEGKVYFSESYVPPVREDQKVRPGQISDLAAWLAARYRPGADGGSLAVSPRSLNERGASSLASQAGAARNALLRYAFNPPMINGLYHLYIDRFMADLNVAAKNRGLSAKENRNFHLALGRLAVLLAQALDAAAELPPPVSSLERQSAELYESVNNAIRELDEMRKSGAGQKQQETMRLRINGLYARYQRSLDELAGQKRDYLARLRPAAGQGLDNDSLLYIADWVGRRLAQGSEAREAARSAAQVLRDLASRCAESGG